MKALRDGVWKGKNAPPDRCQQHQQRLLSARAVVDKLAKLCRTSNLLVGRQENFQAGIITLGCIKCINVSLGHSEASWQIQHCLHTVHNTLSTGYNIIVTLDTTFSMQWVQLALKCGYNNHSSIGNSHSEHCIRHFADTEYNSLDRLNITFPKYWVQHSSTLETAYS